MEMGLGKTVSTLTAINELIYDRFEVQKVLVIAPYRVADDTWTTEADKWDHLKHLRVSKVLGTSGERIAALEADADIYVINRENVTWLVNLTGKEWPFEMIVVDELSSFKSNSAKRFKSLRIVRPLARRFVGLTGTPAPNGLLDLWPQVYLIDRGERLGKTYTGYKDRYFLPDRRNGFVVYSWTPKEGAKEAIEQKLSDICISMKADDYLNLPAQIVNDVYVSMDRHEMRKYRELEKRSFWSLMVRKSQPCPRRLYGGNFCSWPMGQPMTVKGMSSPFMTENWMHLRKSWKHPEAIRSWCSTTSAMIMTG